MGKNVTVPESFVVDVYALIAELEGIFISESVTARCMALERVIKAKLEAKERREAYSAYKTAPIGSDSREAQRRKYLDIAGIPHGWRTKKEQPT